MHDEEHLFHLWDTQTMTYESANESSKGESSESESEMEEADDSGGEDGAQL